MINRYLIATMICAGFLAGCDGEEPPAPPSPPTTPKPAPQAGTQSPGGLQMTVKPPRAIFGIRAAAAPRLISNR